MKRLTSTFLMITLLGISFVSAMKTTTSPYTAISQKKVAKNSCGPCSVFNALANGSEMMQKFIKELPGDTKEKKAKSLIKNYAEKTSQFHKGTRARYIKELGMHSADVLALLKDCMRSDGSIIFEQQFLERNKSETQLQHLHRVHQILQESLRAEFPPIIDVKSHVAQPSENNEFFWNLIGGHYVTVVEIQPILTKDDSSFWFRYTDSETGKTEMGLAHVELSRNFTAVLDASIAEDGKETMNWSEIDFPFLMVTANSLKMSTDEKPWFQRTTIVMRTSIVARKNHQTPEKPNE